MNTFSNEDLKNLQYFLTKVTLTGSEALALVLLQQKIVGMTTTSPTTGTETPKEEKKEE